MSLPDDFETNPVGTARQLEAVKAESKRLADVVAAASKPRHDHCIDSWFANLDEALARDNSCG